MAQVPLQDAGDAVIVEGSSTSDDMITLKKASYQKGEQPEHLEQYSAEKTGLANLSKKCEGKEGQQFTACMRKEARKAGIGN